MKASQGWFKELWNAVWHFEETHNETITFLVDTGMGHLICYAVIIVPVFVAFMLYQEYLHWHYFVKPERAFQRRNDIVTRTKDFSVYDMTDEELECYEASLEP